MKAELTQEAAEDRSAGYELAFFEDNIKYFVRLYQAHLDGEPVDEINSAPMGESYSEDLEDLVYKLTAGSDSSEFLRLALEDECQNYRCL